MSRLYYSTIRYGTSQQGGYNKVDVFVAQVWRRADWGFGLGSQPFIKCPQHNCWVTDKRDIIPVDNFDAVLMMGEPQVAFVHMSCELAKSLP